MQLQCSVVARKYVTLLLKTEWLLWKIGRSAITELLKIDRLTSINYCDISELHALSSYGLDTALIDMHKEFELLQSALKSASFDTLIVSVEPKNCHVILS